jgi:proteic killer suppression protein
MSKKTEIFSKGYSIGKTLINGVVSLESLKIPPGNLLEALKHDRKDQHSIRINDQFRVCFVWTDDGVENVEITDYH